MHMYSYITTPHLRNQGHVETTLFAQVKRSPQPPAGTSPPSLVPQCSVRRPTIASLARLRDERSCWDNYGKARR